MNIFFVLVFLIEGLSKPATCVTFERNAYKGINVAIASNLVDENPTLIEKIETLLTRASRALYVATGHRAYFAEFNIIIPNHWRLPKVEKIQKITDSQWFESASIKIDEPHPGYGNQPYTLQPFGCGESGIHIHYTPEYILESYENIYGPIGKVFVHEWAHLRYGVFDESADGNQQSPFFYIGEDKKIYPSNCPQNVKGWMLRPNGESCLLTSSGIPTADCSFYPDTDPKANQHLKGSLMSFSFMNSVNSFCNESEGIHAKHNFLAPTRHNIMCRGRSVWNVTMSHKDFINATELEVENTTPVFNIFQYQTFERKNLVVLLDMSASMSGPKFDSILTSLGRLVGRWLHEGQNFALVGFCKQYGPKNATQAFQYNYTEIFVNVTQIRADIRGALQKKFPKRQTGGKTTLGEGLVDSIKFLNDSGLNCEQTDLLLITDSKTTEGRRVSDINLYIKESGVRVHSIGLGGNVTRSLSKLCRDTGGNYYHVLDKNETVTTPHDLEVAFMDVAWLGEKKRPQLRGQMETVTVNSVDKGGHVNGHFYVDSSNNVNLTVYFFDFRPWPNVHLQSNSYYSTKVQNVLSDLNAFLEFTIPKAETGQWDYTIISHGNTSAYFAVVTEGYASVPEFNQLKIQEFRPSSTVNYTTSPTPSLLYGIVTVGNNKPVLQAKVSVKFCTPEGECTAKTLHDDGHGTDNRAWDGIYSGTLLNFTNNGTYSTMLSVEVTKDSFTISPRISSSANGSGPLSGAPEHKALPTDFRSTSVSPSSSFDPHQLRYANETEILPSRLENDLSSHWPNVVAVKVESMVRTTPAIAFHLMNFQPHIDVIPPARVRDLYVTDISLHSYRVQNLVIGLEWTSSGDDVDIGTAAFVEIRYGSSPRFYNYFQDGLEIKDSELSRGSLKPLPAGELHHVEIIIKMQSHMDEADLLFFALRTWDESGNVAEPSNIATAYLPQIEIYATGPATNLGAYALGAILGLIFLIILLVIVLKLIQCHRATQAKNADLDSSYAQSRSRPTSHTGTTPRPSSYHNHLKPSRGNRNSHQVAQASKRPKTLPTGMSKPMEDAVCALISEFKEQTNCTANENASFCASRQNLAMTTLPRK